MRSSNALAQQDRVYREKLLEPLRVCANYRPKFGVGTRGDKTIDLAGFRSLFGADPLYTWIGLDSPYMYTAHKAAGGMTSIYRQLGIGCERLFRQVVQDNLGLSDTEVRWGYNVVVGEGDSARTQRLTLDARIDRNHIRNRIDRQRLDDWINRVNRVVESKDERRKVGAVFEVRQGYKSADSKRQNADLRFGLKARDENYLPVVMIVSNQVSQTVARRYRQYGLVVLTGTLDDDDCVSTFAFCENVLGYSLTAFFERNSDILRKEVATVLDGLLSPTDDGSDPGDLDDSSF